MFSITMTFIGGLSFGIAIERGGLTSGGKTPAALYGILGVGELIAMTALYWSQ